MARVVNAVLKRLETTARDQGGAAAARTIREYIENITFDVQKIPDDSRFAHIPTKPGTLDITSCRYFLSHPQSQIDLVDIIKDKFAFDLSVEGQIVHAHAIIRVMLKHLSTINSIFSCKQTLTNDDLAVYATALNGF